MSNNSSILIIYEDFTVNAIFTAIYTIILFATLIGCSLVLSLFYMERKNRKIAHNYVISLCFADIMHGCVGSAVCIHYCNGLVVSSASCHIETALMMATAYISLYNLVTTAIDRYLSIVHPLKYRTKMTHGKSYMIITCGWIVGTGFGLGIIALRSSTYLEKPGELCLYLTLVVDPIYLFAYVQFLVYAGVVITVCIYIRIYVELRRVFQANLGRSNIMSILQWVREKQKEWNTSNIGFLKLREVRMTLLMFVTMSTMVICWIPVLLVVMTFRNDPNFGKIGILITYALPKIYSMINPVFYAYTIKGLRNAFKRLMSSFRRKKHHQMVISSPISSQ